MFQLILHRFALWLKAWNNNFSYSKNDLFTGPDGILKWYNR